jgi:hypothetical protein
MTTWTKIQLLRKAGEENKEYHHGHKGQERLGVINGGPGEVPDEDGVFDQRDEMKNQPEANGGFHHFGQQVPALAQQEERIHQPDSIKSHRNSEPN